MLGYAFMLAGVARGLLLMNPGFPLKKNAVGSCVLVAMLATAVSAQDSPCVSEAAYTLDEDTPRLSARDSARADPVQGGGLILSEVVDAGRGMTLTIVGRSCLSYVVEYVLNLDSVPTGPIDALSLLADALEEIEPHDRSPVPVQEIADVLRDRAGELLEGERVAMGANELGETVRVEYVPGPPTTVVRLVYVVGL